MIGQKSLMNDWLERKAKNTLPVFSILVGANGSGKETFCREFCDEIKIDYLVVDNKVDDLRDLVERAYREQSPIMYIIRDADTMTVNAKNSILKLAEEPPVNAYIVLLVNNLENILGTLISRGSIFQMFPYSKQELLDYGKTLSLTEDKIMPMLDFCFSPGDINTTVENIKDVQAFKTFVNYFVDNIGFATLSNVLKVAKKIRTSQDGEGYDIMLFLQCLKGVLTQKCFKSKKDLIEKYIKWNDIISDAIRELGLSSVNKNMLIDNVIIGGWQELCNYGN